jgi:hypothetical protein
MKLLKIGNPSIFAIESGVTKFYERLSQRAIGYFVIYVNGKRYGVKSPDASLLACSFDAVNERLLHRGTHSVEFASEPKALKVVNAYIATQLNGERKNDFFWNLSANEFGDILVLNKIVWAPDGDAAFDDGSYVLQFDVGAKVRLIAFKNAESAKDIEDSISDIWLDADEYYNTLDEWQKSFELQRGKSMRLVT